MSSDVSALQTNLNCQEHLDKLAAPRVIYHKVARTSAADLERASQQLYCKLQYAYHELPQKMLMRFFDPTSSSRTSRSSSEPSSASTVRGAPVRAGREWSVLVLGNMRIRTRPVSSSSNQKLGRTCSQVVRAVLDRMHAQANSD